MSATAATGQVVGGRYRLTDRLDEDPYGRSLWRAVDELGGALATIKLFADPRDPAAEALPAIARAAGALRHPHIAAVLEAREGERPFVAYEALDGQTLASALHGQPLSVAVAIRVAEQLLWALEHAHERGLVHGRIAPRTVFLTKSSEGLIYAKLLDFGQPKDRGDRVCADLKAVGSLLYEMISGEAPRAPAPPLGAACPDAGAPPLLDHVVAIALSGPGENFASATEMRGALQVAAGQLTRPRSRRAGRVSVSTAPSMRRAMNEVHDYQTTEIAAIPAAVTDAIRRSVADRIAAGRADLEPVAAEAGAAGPGRGAVTDDAVVGAAPTTERVGPRRPQTDSHQATDARDHGPDEPERPPRPPADAERAERRASWVVLAILLLLAGAVAVALLTTRPPPPHRGRTTPGTVAPAAATRMRLSLASTPAGATVTRGEETLGETPLTLDLEEGSHTLTLQREGYEPQTLTVEALGAHAMSHTVRLIPIGP